MHPRMLFVNIGWMDEYRGLEKNGTRGNHRHLQDNKHGHESYNFKDIEGACYGYVPKSIGVNVQRLGAPSGEDEAEGILVVWMARDPERKKTYIVGWYENAVVHKKARLTPKRGQRVVSDYCMSAASSDVTLVPVDERVFYVPSAQAEDGGFGQSAYWYADKREDIQEEVYSHIKWGIVPDRFLNDLPEYVMPSKFPVASHSWTIFSSSEAEKTLDHSAFEYDGSGIPKKVVAFFEFDHRISKQDVTLSFNGSDYKAYLKKDPTGRVQIKWYSDFTDELKAFFPLLEQSSGNIRFIKEGNGRYGIQFLEGGSFSLWDILEASSDEQDEELDETRSYTEKKQRSLHKRIDRNTRLIKAVKKHKGYVCEVCGMSYEEEYGEIGREFIEAHHLVPISTLEEGTEVPHDPVEDFAVLCANCHRMIHRMDDSSDIEGLRRRLVVS